MMLHGAARNINNKRNLSSSHSRNLVGIYRQYRQEQK